MKCINQNTNDKGISLNNLRNDDSASTQIFKQDSEDRRMHQPKRSDQNKKDENITPNNLWTLFNFQTSDIY